MTPFNLTALPPILLKKIATKLEWKSSFRLQQTSKKMEEFVRIHRNFQEIYMVTCGNPMVEINDHGIANFRRYYDFIKEILEFLKVEFLPHLRRFRIVTSFERITLPYTRQILKEFESYSPQIETDREIVIRFPIGSIEFCLTMETFYAQ